MSHTPSLARASSTTPLPRSAFGLPEDVFSTMTDQIAAMRDVLDSYELVASLLAPGAERPSVVAVGALLRIVNGEMAVRLGALEGLLAEA